MTSGDIKILITAGEASGDRLGAYLIKALRQALPGHRLNCFGVGGRYLSEAGLSSLFPMSDLSVLGLFEGIKAYPLIKKRVAEMASYAKAEKPDIAILIDSWGFSLRLAKALRRQNPDLPLIKYVGPQVFASRPGRARTLAKVYDHFLATQGLEIPFYEGLPIDVTFVGNPSLNLESGRLDQISFRQGLGLAPDKPILAILLGSRKSEVLRLKDPFGEAAARLYKNHTDLTIIMPLAETVSAEVKAAVSDWSVPVIFIEDPDKKYDAMASATLALAASGTVATELAICQAPMVIGYRISFLGHLMLKPLIRAKYATLLNITLDQEVVPEYLQGQCTGENLAKALERLLQNPEKRQKQIREQNEALEQMGLGKGDPSYLAAEKIKAILSAKGKI